MLCQFSFKNFKSYKDETTFDFQAATLPEFPESLITNENCSDLLPVSVIYGPNGGGKTNLLRALACVISFVVKPIYDLQKTRIQLVVQQSVTCEPFKFNSASPNEPTEFNLYFRAGHSEYRYYLAVSHDEVISEFLYRRTLGGKKTATIFERDNGVITLGSSINKASINKDVNPKMSYLSFLAINYNLPVIAEVQAWFESCIIRDYANPEVDRSIFLMDSSNPAGNKFKMNLIHALNDMGIDITDYRYDGDQNQFFLQRRIANHTYELPFQEESDGTKKLFASFPFLMLALAEGRIVVIDELDAKLHPKLLRYIISLFTNRKINKNGAQLLFTSHDLTTMSNDVFRRDEIWFAALDNNRGSEIYSLYEIRNEKKQRINQTAAYNKQYLEGRYGADPYLRSMLDWEALQ